VIAPGFAYFNPIRTPPHLWVVVTEPNDDGDIVVVMLTTLRGRSDTTCILEAGAHPWIKHDTVPAYQIAEWQSVERLQRLIDQKLVIVRDPLSAALLLRIQQGALESSRTVPRVKAAVRRTLEP
jgi:hypothetical protein